MLLGSEFKDQTSILKSHPPVCKYDYRKIGANFAKQLEESKEQKLEPLEIEQKVEQWLIDYSPEDYCLRQILKMCYYISTVRKIEILSMKADFYIDTNDKVWFFFSKDIIWRNRKLSFSEIQHIDNAKKDIEDKRAKRKLKQQL